MIPINLYHFYEVYMAIGIFISHSWDYEERYEKLKEWFFKTSWQVEGNSIKFIDHSVPQDHPIHNANTDSQLEDALRCRIEKSDVVIIPAGMEVNHSKWIQKEIKISQKCKKPILKVDPWGQKRSSTIVSKSASAECGWNQKSVIDSAYNLAMSNDVVYG